MLSCHHLTLKLLQQLLTFVGRSASGNVIVFALLASFFLATLYINSFTGSMVLQTTQCNVYSMLLKILASQFCLMLRLRVMTLCQCARSCYHLPFITCLTTVHRCQRWYPRSLVVIRRWLVV